jgi:hypothetical protein
LVFFIGGLNVEVKNMIKMFEPKSLKQAYTLARLQDNISPINVITPILIDKLIIQPHSPTKTNFPPLPVTTKIHLGLLITVLNHPTLVSYQAPHLITPTLPIEPLDPSKTGT